LVVSVAWNVTTSAVASVAVKVATPDAFVVVSPAVMTAALPLGRAARVMAWPETGLPNSSVTVTVTVVGVIPSEGGLAGDATTVEDRAPGSGEPEL
jgi:hypothetical protein